LRTRQPPISYWCSDKTQGGGAFSYRVPSGLGYAGLLPHAPYRNATGAIVAAWRPGHWAQWFFRVNEDNGTHFVNWNGGFQDARGADTGQLPSAACKKEQNMKRKKEEEEEKEKVAGRMMRKRSIVFLFYLSFCNDYIVVVDIIFLRIRRS
jgi:hypothetical protein